MTASSSRGTFSQAELTAETQAALKVLDLAIATPQKNRANVTGSTPGWKTALDSLTMYYGDRINPNWGLPHAIREAQSPTNLDKA
jgi:hypothetical protein